VGREKKTPTFKGKKAEGYWRRPCGYTKGKQKDSYRIGIVINRQKKVIRETMDQTRSEKRICSEDNLLKLKEMKKGVPSKGKGDTVSTSSGRDGSIETRVRLINNKEGKIRNWDDVRAL